MNTLGSLSFALLAALYFAPVLLAAARGLSPTTRATIFAANLLLGWTVVAWIVLLIWAGDARPAAT